MDRKQNVLFGTLAVQYRLVTPRQLQPIAQKWAEDPSRDLVDYLSDSDLISAKDVQFVHWIRTTAIRMRRLQRVAGRTASSPWTRTAERQRRAGSMFRNC